MTPIRGAHVVQVKQKKKKKEIQTQYSARLDFLFSPNNDACYISVAIRNGEVKAGITELEIAAAKRNYASRVVSFRGGKFPASGNGRRTAAAAAALLQAAGIFETRELERNSGDLCCENIGRWVSLISSSVLKVDAYCSQVVGS